jgi:ADP-ribose pyrophosphatase
MKYSILTQAPIYKGFFSLTEYRLRHELFGGGESPEIRRELLDRGQAAGVLPYDPGRDEVVLIEQFRVGYRDPGETPEATVARESVEEAGCTVTELVPICRYYSSPASSNEQIHLFTGRTDSTGLGGIHGLAHEGEDIRVHVVSSATAFEWLDNGRIDSAMAIIALQWFRLNRERIRALWETGR